MYVTQGITRSQKVLKKTGTSGGEFDSKFCFMRCASV